MTTLSQRFAWIVIYLNLPLWIVVGILAFSFGEWGIVEILVGVNIGLLLISFLSLARKENN